MKDLGNWKKSSEMSSAIVSDKRVNDNVNSEEEVKAYGGYLVAESVFNEDLRKLIIKLPELLKEVETLINYLDHLGIYHKSKRNIEKILEEIEGDNND